MRSGAGPILFPDPKAMIRAFCLLAATLCLTLVLSACDSGGDAGPEAIDCDSRTGNTMTATVNGTPLCTDLGTALLLNALTPRLSVVGLFENGRSSIAFSLESPDVGTFDLLDVTYGTADESAYFTVDDEDGSGSVTITTFSDTRVQGTFSFDAAGIDADTNAPNGTRARTTDGSFDFAVSTGP